MWIKTIPRPTKGLIMSWDYTFIIIPKNNKKEKIKKTHLQNSIGTI